MTCRNPIKHKFQNAFNSFIDATSFDRKLSDDQMECMQFIHAIILQNKKRKYLFFITK